MRVFYKMFSENVPPTRGHTQPVMVSQSVISSTVLGVTSWWMGSNTNHSRSFKADDIFSTNKAPDWLDDMIAFAKWRQLFYKLIETYPDCVFLNYVIKLISDAGHQGEITNLSTAAAQLDVFARVIKTSLENLLRSCKSLVKDTAGSKTNFF